MTTPPDDHASDADAAERHAGALDGLPEPPAADGPGLFGDGLLGDAPAVVAPKPAYRVLARTYRPTRFDDLIGQEAMVRILRRAFAVGRVAHAFMLTGVRGVGKTTTARIIARALNCIGPDGTGGPTPDPCGVCPNCTAILADRHPDVLEMDAASRTGIDDVREIIEATRFRPMQARMKVFIVDEVHMLSRNAFNALLKTLEEPPSQVTFIFATTELRKVPVTVLSRCQRFDLRRVSQAELSAHFARIAAKEGAVIDGDALGLIARAADGSVRDGLSLLDQAIAQGGTDGDPTIRVERVADMLGLADRGLVFDLLDAVMQGKPAAALAITDQAHARGADLGTMLADLLELIHTVSRLKAVPALRDSNELPEAERVRGAVLADALPVPVLGRAWQMLLKGVAEVEGAPDRREAAEMVLIRLCHVADLPTPGDLVRQIQAQGPQSAVVAAPVPLLDRGSEALTAVAGAGPVQGSGLVLERARLPLAEPRHGHDVAAPGVPPARHIADPTADVRPRQVSSPVPTSAPVEDAGSSRQMQPVPATVPGPVAAPDPVHAQAEPVAPRVDVPWLVPDTTSKPAVNPIGRPAPGTGVAPVQERTNAPAPIAVADPATASLDAPGGVRRSGRQSEPVQGAGSTLPGGARLGPVASGAARPAAVAQKPELVTELVTGPATDPVPSAEPVPPSLRSWREVVAFVATRREPMLHGHLRHCAHLVRFAAPVIELRLEPHAPRDLSQRLAAILTEATGTRWTIAIVREAGEPTLSEQAGALDADRSRDAQAHPLVQAILAAFPGATLGAVNDAMLDDYGLPPEPAGSDGQSSEPLLFDPEAPDMEFAPDDSEPVGPDDLEDFGRGQDSRSGT